MFLTASAFRYRLFVQKVNLIKSIVAIELCLLLKEKGLGQVFQLFCQPRSLVSLHELPLISQSFENIQRWTPYRLPE